MLDLQKIIVAVRDFFIKSLETLINVIVILGAIVIVIAAVVIAFGGVGMDGPTGGGGPLAGLAVLIGGGIYLVLIGGFMYLGLGIYQNTRRTADAVERLAGR